MELMPIGGGDPGFSKKELEKPACFPPQKDLEFHRENHMTTRRGDNVQKE